MSSIGEKDAKLAATLRSLLDEQRQLKQEHFLETSPVHPTECLVGQKLGPYTLVSQIGQGGMGSVWLAQRSDGRFDRQAAVKFLNIALAGRATEERFKREGSILGRLTLRISQNYSTPAFLVTERLISFSKTWTAWPSTSIAMNTSST